MEALIAEIISFSQSGCSVKYLLKVCQILLGLQIQCLLCQCLDERAEERALRQQVLISVDVVNIRAGLD